MLLTYDAAAITQESCWDQDVWEKLETDTAAIHAETEAYVAACNTHRNSRCRKASSRFISSHM